MKLKFSALVAAAALLLSSCSVVSTASMNENAANQYRSFVAGAHKEGVVETDTATARRVQRVFQRILPYADDANQTGHKFEWEMVVIRNDELNAWAMPGGKMAMYTGIVEKLNLSDDEIAAVVGHEMTHALLEHSKKEANRNFGVSLGAQLGASVLQATTGVDGKLIEAGVGLAKDLGVDKPFSRDAEREADIGGLRLMAQAGYHPQAAVTLWQKMNEQEDNNNIFNKVLSTHPVNNERIRLLQNELPNVMPLYEQAKKQFVAEPVKQKKRR